MSTTTGDTTEGSADHGHAHHRDAAGSTLSRAFAVGTTVQLEPQDAGTSCGLASSEVV